MKTTFLWCLSIAALLAGCSKSSNNPVGPSTAPTGNDWVFPANNSKFSVTVYTASDTVAVGQTFYTKVIYYNVSQTFGTALECAYAPDKVRILEVTQGPMFASDTTTISVARVDSVAGTVSMGISYKAGTGKVFNGSNILVRLKCEAKAAGSTAFTINAAKLEILQSDGSSIPNFGSLAVENLSLLIR
jgi:hypothetical protein